MSSLLGPAVENRHERLLTNTASSEEKKHKAVASCGQGKYVLSVSSKILLSLQRHVPVFLVAWLGSARDAMYSSVLVSIYVPFHELRESIT